MTETDPLIHFYLQKIWRCIHPIQRRHAQATHALFAFGPEELTSHPVQLLIPTHLTVRGIQTGPAAINFDANFTRISVNIFVEEKDPFTILHL